MNLAQELGVSFAFPTQTLHLESVATPESSTEQVPHDDAALAATVESFAPGGAKGEADRYKLTHGFWPEA